MHVKEASWKMWRREGCKIERGHQFGGETNDGGESAEAIRVISGSANCNVMCATSKDLDES